MGRRYEMAPEGRRNAGVRQTCGMRAEAVIVKQGTERMRKLCRAATRSHGKARAAHSGATSCASGLRTARYASGLLVQEGGSGRMAASAGGVVRVDRLCGMTSGEAPTNEIEAGRLPHA